MTTYPSLWNVPLVPSKSLKPPKLTPLPFSYNNVNESMLDLLSYDFSLERAVIQESLSESREAAQIEERKSVLEEKRKERKAAETKKKAPGFGGESHVILQPSKAGVKEEKEGKEKTLDKEKEREKVQGIVDELGGLTVSPKSTTASDNTVSKSPPLTSQPQVAATATTSSLSLSFDRIAAKDPMSVSSVKPKTNSTINFSDFEHGLAPPDPWDTRQDDFSALKEVMGPSGPSAVPSGGASGGRSPPTASPPVRSMTVPNPHSIQSHTQYQQQHPHYHQQQQQQPYGTSPSQYDYNASRFQNYPSFSTSPGQRYGSPPSGHSFLNQSSNPAPFLPPKPDELRYGQEAKPKGAPGVPPPPPTQTETPKISIPEGMESAFQSFTSMGFSSASFLSAYKLFGKSESKYIDHLVAYDSLVSAGYSSEDAHDALEIVGPGEKATLAASAIGSLMELGFAREDILKSVKKSGGNRERALEELMK
ncbi:hypothetical protein HDU97_001199 [Phlyctochytrium planicorne]|nr:hypothetical protein HDU97_001199 [Phlyctochytrium planicorne]